MKLEVSASYEVILKYGNMREYPMVDYTTHHNPYNFVRAKMHKNEKYFEVNQLVYKWIKLIINKLFLVLSLKFTPL